MKTNRIVSSITSLVIGFSSVIWAEEAKPPFAIPPAYGAITEYHPGSFKSNQTIVMIQDLHANVGVQKNIAAMLYRLNRLNSSNGALIVCVEGASGEGDVSLLRSLPRVLRKGFESMLLRRAYLTGAELAATEAAADIHQQKLVIWRKIKDFFVGSEAPAPVSLSPIFLWGVDDPELYRVNWKAAKFVDKNQHDALDKWKALRGTLLAGATPEMQKHLDRITKILLLRLQPEEYIAYKKNRSMNPKLPADLAKVLEQAEVYYKAADDRSVAMVNNVLKKMGAKPGLIALISGGFHTAEMATIFKQKGYSYVVITPDVQTLDQDMAYKARLREEE